MKWYYYTPGFSSNMQGKLPSSMAPHTKTHTMHASLCWSVQDTEGRRQPLACANARLLFSSFFPLAAFCYFSTMMMFSVSILLRGELEIIGWKINHIRRKGRGV